MRIPKTEAERRAAAVRRQQRYMQRKKLAANADAIVDHVLGGDTPIPADVKGIDRDLAALLRDRLYDKATEMSDAALMNKDNVPALNLGLKAQKQVEDREKAKAKQGNAELAFAIIGMLTGAAPPPKQLEDGMTVDGEFDEVE